MVCLTEWAVTVVSELKQTPWDCSYVHSRLLKSLMNEETRVDLEGAQRARAHPKLFQIRFLAATKQLYKW